ncbi:hypothetical protein V2J09_023091 [Rumex salicifolius]
MMLGRFWRKISPSSTLLKEGKSYTLSIGLQALENDPTGNPNCPFTLSFTFLNSNRNGYCIAFLNTRTTSQYAGYKYLSTTEHCLSTFSTNDYLFEGLTRRRLLLNDSIGCCFEGIDTNARVARWASEGFRYASKMVNTICFDKVFLNLRVPNQRWVIAIPV